DIIPDVIGKGLPEHNSIGAVFSEIFLQRKILLIVAVAPATESEDLESRIAPLKILFKIPFGHRVRWTWLRLDLGIADQNNYDITIGIVDRLSSVSKLIDISTGALPAGSQIGIPRWLVQ